MAYDGEMGGSQPLLRHGARFAYLVAVSACQFSAPLDAGVDGELPAAPFCGPSADLVACYVLDGDATDAAGASLHGVGTGVAYVAGRAGMAARLTTGSSIDVAEAAALDVPAITMEAWIRPSQLPATRSGIVDNNGQYGLFLHPGGALQCIGVSATANVAVDVWTHVACTYDGTTRIYKDGVEVGASAGGGGALGTGGTTGISIGADNPPGAGAPLLGDIDGVRIWKVARTRAELCAGAGLACP